MLAMFVCKNVMDILVFLSWLRVCVYKLYVQCTCKLMYTHICEYIYHTHISVLHVCICLC